MDFYSEKIKAKKLIIDLFAKKKELDYAEIMSELELDLTVVVEICDDLEREGKIKTIFRKEE